MIREQLEQWLGIEVWKLPEWYTRKEIAEAIGASKSPSLLYCLNQATEKGVFETWKTKDDKNRVVIKYKISDSYREQIFEEIEEEKRKRVDTRG